MLLLLLLPAVCLGADGPGPAWDYSAGPAGPANWHENYPKCAGARQSPVDLRPTEETVAAPLQLQGYDEFFKNMTTHAGEGHVSLTGNSVPLMSGGGLPAAYRLQQVHFHWGKGAYSKGSEHTVAGKQYPVEAHLVHYKATFDDIGQAIASGAQDSLAVLGIFLEEGDIGQAAGDVLSEALPKLEEDGVSGVDLSYIIGAADLASFYRYEGGLTTPSCDQIVLWTVLVRPVTVRFDHLAMFWNSMVLDAPNFRPVQPLNGRSIALVSTTTTSNYITGCDAPTVGEYLSHLPGGEYLAILSNVDPSECAVRCTSQPDCAAWTAGFSRCVLLPEGGVAGTHPEWSWGRPCHRDSVGAPPAWRDASPPWYRRNVV